VRWWVRLAGDWYVSTDVVRACCWENTVDKGQFLSYPRHDCNQAGCQTCPLPLLQLWLATHQRRADHGIWLTGGKRPSAMPKRCDRECSMRVRTLILHFVRRRRHQTRLPQHPPCDTASEAHQRRAARADLIEQFWLPDSHHCSQHRIISIRQRFSCADQHLWRVLQQRLRARWNVCSGKHIQPVFYRRMSGCSPACGKWQEEGMSCHQTGSMQ